MLLVGLSLCCGMHREQKHNYPSLLQFDRDWFAEGALPSLPGGSKFTEAAAIHLSHQLADSLYKLRKMIHSAKVKLQAARWDMQCMFVV